MKPSSLYEAIHVLIPQRVPLHIWGSPGVGKSQIVAQVARELSYQFLDVRASQLDPVDWRGIPHVEQGQTTWAAPKFLPSNSRGILFLDELTSAPQMTQAACYQLVLDRKLGEYELPDEWLVIAAGNRASDRGVHFAMPRPLRNRFVHLDLDPDLQEWCEWAVKARIRPEIIAFLRFKPDLLHQPGSLDANAWPTPRSWEMASQVLGGSLSRQKLVMSNPQIRMPDVELDLLSGAVGDATAGEFTAFLRLYRQLPSIDQILLTPDQAPVPSEPSAQYAVATALGRYMTDQSIGRGLRYLDRLPEEFKILAVRDAVIRDQSLTHTPEFVAFGVQHAEVIQ
jgi:ATPase family associated with various cellular activities (AAA)